MNSITDSNSKNNLITQDVLNEYLDWCKENVQGEPKDRYYQGLEQIRDLYITSIEKLKDYNVDKVDKFLKCGNLKIDDKLKRSIIKNFNNTRFKIKVLEDGNFLCVPSVD